MTSCKPVSELYISLFVLREKIKSKSSQRLSISSIYILCMAKYGKITVLKYTEMDGN